MTGRLAAISSLIEPARVIADVGCDHGLIAEYCVKNDVCERVIASDISATCLNKAKSKLAAYKNVTFTVCDGIEYECDEAIIAGMGGLLISAILEKAAVLPQTLVLCPHRDADIVRRTLIRLRYSIDGDIIAEERGKIYFIIRARRDGGAQALDELQYLFGVNYRYENDLLKAYLQKLYDICMLAPDKNADRLASVLAAMTAQGMRLHDQFVHKGAKMEDSLKKKFQTLLEYQKKDIELRKLNSILERDQALASMTKHKRIFNEAKQTINDCEQQSGELIGMYEELQRYVDENEAALAALEGAEACSEEELEARVKKLDSLKSKFQSADKKMHAVDEKSRAVCKARVDAVKSGNAAKQQFAEAKGKHAELVNSKSAELDKLKTELEQLRAALDEKLYAEYSKLVGENKFPPIVPAASDERKGMFNCGGCGLGLPQQGNAYLKDRGWCYCDNCRRIIVKLN